VSVFKRNRSLGCCCHSGRPGRLRRSPLWARFRAYVAKPANARSAASHLEEPSVQIDDLCQREIPDHARRRYNSSFFFRTRYAAVAKSSPVPASMSTIAPLARSWAVRPQTLRLSAWAAERSMESFTCYLYRVRLSRPTICFSGPAAPAAEHKRYPFMRR